MVGMRLVARGRVLAVGVVVVGGLFSPMGVASWLDVLRDAIDVPVRGHGESWPGVLDACELSGTWHDVCRHHV